MTERPATCGEPRMVVARWGRLMSFSWVMESGNCVGVFWMKKGLCKCLLYSIASLVRND